MDQFLLGDSRRLATRNTGTQVLLEVNMVHINNDETTPSPRPRLGKTSITVAEAAAQPAVAILHDDG